jgi:hypothetical protein
MPALTFSADRNGSLHYSPSQSLLPRRKKYARAGVRAFPVLQTFYLAGEQAVRGTWHCASIPKCGQQIRRAGYYRKYYSSAI